MGCRIFTRKARKLFFHNEIQQSGINLTRFSISSGSNQSTNKIIVVGVGEVTQFSIILSHRDKASKTTHKHSRNKRKETNRKRGQIKWQGWSGGEENERQMSNNVMRGIRVCDGYLVCLVLCVDLPGNGARNPSCYLLSTALVFPWSVKGDAAK